MLPAKIVEYRLTAWAGCRAVSARKEVPSLIRVAPPANAPLRFGSAPIETRSVRLSLIGSAARRESLIRAQVKAGSRSPDFRGVQPDTLRKPYPVRAQLGGPH